MTEASQTTQNQAVRKPVQINNKTFLIVLLFVIVPWVALALPGYFGGSQELFENNIKSESIVNKFGWPLTHKTETELEIIGVKRGGQFRVGEKLPDDKFQALLDTHIAQHEENGEMGMLNLIPSAAEGRPLTSAWTNQTSYPVEIRRYIADNVIESGMRQTWNTPMMIANIVMAVLATLLVGFLCEKSFR